MKTFGKKINDRKTQFDAIQKGILIAICLLLFISSQLMAQGTLTGFVVDDEFDEPLEKAVVTIPGTLISVLTDQQGKFSIKLVAGDYFLEVNYPGYFRKQYNMSVSDGITTPMFIIKLKANAVGRALQRSVSSYENKRLFPQTTENFSTWQTTEQNGNQEFNQLLKTLPSVSFHSNGSGFNDSEIGFRGNDANRTNYSLNGISLNNPETGRMGSSLLSGLTDWAGQIQVISGQAANLQSQAGSGGQINVLSLAPHEKAGADVLAVYGNNGFLKTSATIHSGLSKNGLASLIQVSRTSGNGLAQNTAFQQYGFMVNIQKEINQFHTLVLSLNGVVQQHDVNPSDSIGAYNRYGTKYNREWGYLNKKALSWSTNYGRSPLLSLTHFWHPRIKTQITTQLFAEFNRSAQLFPEAPILSSIPRDSTGLIVFDKISDWNKGTAVAEMGANRVPDTNGKYINSETSGISTLAAINRENRYGLRTIFTHQFSKKLDVSTALNLEEFQASHFGAVENLLGANGFTSFSDLNRPEGFSVQNFFQPGFFASFNKGTKTAFDYQSKIQSGGISFRLNYQLSRFYWYLAGSASIRDIRRTDHFNYLATDRATNSGFELQPGGHAQTGIRFNFWKYHSVFLRTSYGSYQSLFTTIFPSANNWKNEQATNEQVFDSEFGYTIFSRKMKIEAVAYRSQIANRTMVGYANLHPGDSFGLVNGPEELHQGVELKTSYKLTGNFQINLNGSLGDWHYAKDATATIYGSNNQQTASNDLWIKGVRIANAPQLSLFAEAEYRWANNFYIRLNYSRADRIYAPFGFYDFKDLAARSDFKQWQLPAYDLLGFSANYLVRLTKKLSANFILGGQNLLDTEYIEQSETNIPEGNPHYTSNLVHYGMGRTWFGGMRVQF